MFAYGDGSSSKLSGGGGTRAESISSVSGATTTSNRTMHSSEHTSDSGFQHRPFIVRNGRTYLADPTLAYPLPVDLQELHRQSLRTILLLQLYGRPICTPTYANKPPPRILEIGCGTGFWSMMCYEHYKERGQHKDMSFTGLDIVPLPPNSSPNSSVASSSSSADTSADSRPAKGMNWRFVQHDIRKLPFPFPDASFDLVMAKDMNLTITIPMQQGIVEEYTRILAPGGTLEIWDCDQMLRMLRPHVPDCPTTSGPAAATDHDNSSTPTPTQDYPQPPAPDEGDETELGGAYVMTPKTPLSTPLNNFLEPTPAGRLDSAARTPWRAAGRTIPVRGLPNSCRIPEWPIRSRRPLYRPASAARLPRCAPQARSRLFSASRPCARPPHAAPPAVISAAAVDSKAAAIPPTPRRRRVP